METLFFYGTLRYQPLLDLVMGQAHNLRVTQAQLPEHEVLWAKGESFPMIRPAKGGCARGVLIEGVDAAFLKRLDFYEGGFAYTLRDVMVDVNGRQVGAQVYFPEEGLWTPGAPWSLAQWEGDWGDITLYAAREVMGYYGHLDAGEVARRFPMIRARAATRVRAAQSAPTTLRANSGPEDLSIRETRQPYSNYFTLEEQDIAFRRFDGEMSDTVTRAGFIGIDAVTVLPYDPVRDRVLVIEQFRFGPHVRGDPKPWVLEPVAGRIDAGESPEDCAHRETLEEAGLRLQSLQEIARYYPSPGAFSEFLISYVAIADLPDGAARVAGLAQEDEDIRGHVLSFDRLMELVSSGEAGCGPLVLSAFWLSQNRARLGWSP